MAYTLGYAETALEDVVRVVKVLRVQVSEQAGKAFLRALESSEKNLLAMPRMGKAYDEYPLNYNYRWILVKAYVLYYTLDEESESITVYRLLHQSQNNIGLLH